HGPARRRPPVDLDNQDTITGSAPVAAADEQAMRTGGTSKEDLGGHLVRLSSGRVAGCTRIGGQRPSLARHPPRRLDLPPPDLVLSDSADELAQGRVPRVLR